MDAPRTTAHDDTLLIFAIHGIRCGVPAQSVDSIVMPPHHLTQPPGSNRTRPGIFVHNGQVHGVVDLREAFGLHDPNSTGGRLLLYHFGELHYAFVVDEVVGLARSEEGQWAPLPPDLPRKTFTRGFLHHKQIVLCSDFPRLLRLEDGEPLRRHFAAVVTARNTATAAPAAPASALPSSTPVAPATTATPLSPLPANSTPRAAPPPQVDTPPRPQARAAQSKAPVIRPSLRTTTTAKPSVAGSPPKAGRRPQPVAPRPLRPTEPLTEPPPPTAPTSQHRRVPPAFALPLLLLCVAAGWWFWPAHELQVAPPPTPPVPLLTPPAPALAKPLQPLRIEKGSSGLTLIVEESAFNATANEAVAPVATPHEVRRIVHRVKKGETLWGIAERYVHNPWRFRELAHQSGIDNPDLIYPGDEVTILIR